MGEDVIKKNEVPRLGRHPTRIVLESLGELEFRSISGRDSKIIFELLKRVGDDKEFALALLHNQLVKPEIDLEKFRDFSDSDIRLLIKEFIKDEYNLSDYFNETEDSEFFENFRNAIEEYLLNINKSMIDSLYNIDVFSQNYVNVVRPIDLSSVFPKTINLGPIMRALSGFNDLSKVITSVSKIDYSKIINASSLGAASLAAATNQINSTANLLSNVLGPQINTWNHWADVNKQLFNETFEQWDKFEKRYKIARAEAISALKKYKWFMTPSLPIDFVFSAVKIGRRSGNQRRMMNILFVEYFSEDNFVNLRELLDVWASKNVFDHRMKIFRDCVSVITQSDKKTNPSNLVIPTLIAQIDGIQREFMASNGIIFKKKGGLKDSRGHGVKWRSWYENLTSDGELLDSANDIFLNILFQDADHGKPLKTPYTFSRHKIMHGEYYRYGRFDNTIRAFLILDFFAALMDDS